MLDDILSDELGAFRQSILDWFQREGRDYPWRRTHDPYAVLVSELMLQQTQVATVLGRGYFERWMNQFPDVASLAEASEDAILKAWEGLGYYRRARHLQKAAQAVVRDHGGVFPEDFAEIRALPGVGDYTAGAVASFAFNQAVPVVDGNIARVLARLFDFREGIETTGGKRTLNQWAAQLVDPVEARIFNSGLMELGQRICTPRSPQCGHCPVSRFCRAEDPASLPVKKKRPQTEQVEEWAVYLRDGDRVLLQRESGNRRQGLWKLPIVGGRDGREEVLRSEYSITRYRVTLTLLRGLRGDRELDGAEWRQITEVAELAMASPYRKALERLLEMESGEYLL